VEAIMSTMLEFDEETARHVEAVYSTADVVEQRRAIRAALALQPGERVADIGCGPGFLAAEMAAEVGADGHVHAVDPSESMLAITRRRQTAAGAAPLEIAPGNALALPLADAGLDAAVCTQVLEYVDDVPAALADARRVLRPGGRLLILDTDWDAIVWHSRDPARMRRVLEAWNEHLADPYLPRRLPGLLRSAGFELSECTIAPILNLGYAPPTYSTGLIDIVAGFAAGRAGVTEAEAKPWADDLTGLGDDYFFSLNRYQFVATR
jgi:arsenite methyltransferase